MSLSSSKLKNKFTCKHPELQGVTEGKARRLTHNEIKNSITVIFGAKVVKNLENTFSLYAPEAYDQDVHEFDPKHTRSHVDALVEVAIAVADKATEVGSSIFPPCLLEGKSLPLNFVLSDPKCNKLFVRNLGQMVFRRPLAKDQVDDFAQILVTNDTEFKNARERVSALISALLLDPNFIFHFSHADPTIQAGNRIGVDQYSIASRLSFRLTGAGPDQLLFEAAKDNRLRDFGELQRQAERLIATSLGRDYVRHLFAQWLKIGQEPGLKEVYAQHLGVNRTGLVESMRVEALDFVEHIVFEKKGNFQDLVQSNLAFPRNADLAKLMKTSISNGPQDPRATSDGRRGLYMRPVLMLSPETRTSVIHRGYLFNKQFLCRKIPPPADADLLEGEERLADIDPLKMTAREEAAYVTSPSNCMTCHNTINPPGFALESFGPFGEIRAQETIFDPTGSVVRTLPIDNSLDNFILDGKLQSFASLQQFHAALASAQETQACFSQKLFRLAKLQMEESEDECHLARVETRIRNNESLLNVLIQNAVTEDILWQSQN